MGHRLRLISENDIGENKRQGHGTLLFLKIGMRHWTPPIKSLMFMLHTLHGEMPHLEPEDDVIRREYKSDNEQLICPLSSRRVLLSHSA